MTGPVIDDVITTRPWSDFLRCGRQALIARKVPLRLVAMTWSQSSGESSSILVCGKIPALAHRMSMPPCAVAAASAMTCMSPNFVTSAAWPFAVPPARRSSAAQASASSRWRDTMSTFPPFLEKTFAIPFPMPLLDPVTTTDRPAIDVSMAFLQNSPRKKAPLEQGGRRLRNARPNLHLSRK